MATVPPQNAMRRERRGAPDGSDAPVRQPKSSREGERRMRFNSRSFFSRENPECSGEVSPFLYYDSGFSARRYRIVCTVCTVCTGKKTFCARCARVKKLSVHGVHGLFKNFFVRGCAHQKLFQTGLHPAQISESFSNRSAHLHTGSKNHSAHPAQRALFPVKSH